MSLDCVPAGRHVCRWTHVGARGTGSNQREPYVPARSGGTPAAADRLPHPGRRSLLRNAGLAAMAAVVAKR